MGFSPRTMYQTPAREERGKLARADVSPSPPQSSSLSGRLASSMQCCSCCKHSHSVAVGAVKRDLDVASVEIVKGVRLIIGNAVEGACLPRLKVQNFDMIPKMVKSVLTWSDPQGTRQASAFKHCRSVKQAKVSDPHL